MFGEKYIVRRQSQLQELTFIPQEVISRAGSRYQQVTGGSNTLADMEHATVLDRFPCMSRKDTQRGVLYIRIIWLLLMFIFLSAVFIKAKKMETTQMSINR